MAEYQPIYTPGIRQTHFTSAAVTGGQLLAVSGNGTLAPTSGATAGFIGAAANDAASGGRVTVFCGGQQELVASGSVTAGATVEAAANGRVASHTNGTNDINVVGVALTTAADGAKLRVAMAR